MYWCLGKIWFSDSLARLVGRSPRMGNNTGGNWGFSGEGNPTAHRALVIPPSEAGSTGLHPLWPLRLLLYSGYSLATVKWWCYDDLIHYALDPGSSPG
jgi:hypothetical protein